MFRNAKDVVLTSSNENLSRFCQIMQNIKKGSVLVDVAIDQGGCFETSKATTHSDPTYVVDDIVHYCVANMPGGVPRTSTLALNTHNAHHHTACTHHTH